MLRDFTVNARTYDFAGRLPKAAALLHFAAATAFCRVVRLEPRVIYELLSVLIRNVKTPNFETCFLRTQLLVPQRHHRVHIRRAFCRNVTSHECHRDQQQGYCPESDGIGARHSKQQRRHSPRKCKRSHNPSR